MTYPPRDKVLMSLQVPTGDWNMDRHMRALVKRVNNWAMQKLRSLVNRIFHGVVDFALGAVRLSAAQGYLVSKDQQKIKRMGEIWMSEEKWLSMSRSIAAESEQLGVVRGCTI